jgi:hypothetical protein
VGVKVTATSLASCSEANGVATELPGDHYFNGAPSAALRGFATSSPMTWWHPLPLLCGFLLRLDLFTAPDDFNDSATSIASLASTVFAT